ncbi:helix-turn-helix domain-containing protein [Aeromicrobium alkaliterrae]|uniref:TetR/AcrR family transcriptional regulator n=1 Tax=Aeromicrobium alkaliterrae TaxID=302168 RepID=A0ABP4WED5_9ACTN
MTDTVVHIAQRPKRGDAARNYDALLLAARSEFESHGTSASLTDVATRAGVAIGTLYRHFPTRETLIEALTRDSLHGLIRHAEELESSSEAEAALREWVAHAVDHASVFRGLAALLSEEFYREGTPNHAACEQMHGAAERLLARAQAARTVRDSVTSDELWSIILSAAWIRETSPAEADRSNVVLRFALDGITVAPTP